MKRSQNSSKLSQLQRRLQRCQPRSVKYWQILDRIAELEARQFDQMGVV